MIVDSDIKPQHKQKTYLPTLSFVLSTKIFYFILHVQIFCPCLILILSTISAYVIATNIASQGESSSFLMKMLAFKINAVFF